MGNRNKPGGTINGEAMVGDFSSFVSTYYTTTGGLTFHFGRLSTDLTVTYLFNNDFEPMDAKLSANVGLRFYLYKKIYKTK